MFFSFKMSLFNDVCMYSNTLHDFRSEIQLFTYVVCVIHANPLWISGAKKSTEIYFIHTGLFFWLFSLWQNILYIGNVHMMFVSSTIEYITQSKWNRIEFRVFEVRSSKHWWIQEQSSKESNKCCGRRNPSQKCLFSWSMFNVQRFWFSNKEWKFIRNLLVRLKSEGNAKSKVHPLKLLFFIIIYHLPFTIAKTNNAKNAFCENVTINWIFMNELNMTDVTTSTLYTHYSNDVWNIWTIHNRWKKQWEEK